MLGFCFFGFLFGMAHAFEADHLAAIASLSGDSDENGWRKIVARGFAWGIGHTITLFFICSIVLTLGFQITKINEAQLEFVVGVMLIGLGVRVLWKLLFFRTRLQRSFDIAGSTTQFKAHCREGDTPIQKDNLQGRENNLKNHLAPLAIGLVHGAAGSAGLLALALAGTQTIAITLSYVLLFSFGSLLGMGALSLLIFWPFWLAERSTNVTNFIIMGLTGFIAIGVGLMLIIETGPIAFKGLLLPLFA